MHLAVAGNIGSGKTTLTTLLAKHYRYTPHFEEVDNNPYLWRDGSGQSRHLRSCGLLGRHPHCHLRG